MGLRRYVKANERETFLIVFVVMAGLAAYLGPWGVKPPKAATPLPTPVASDGGMEKLWLEASLAKGDMRPIPDEVRFDEETAPEAPSLPEPPSVPPEEPAAPEPARSFPEPLPVAEAYEAPERQRISPMRESLLETSRSGSASSAFLAFPKSVKETAPSPAYAPSASPAPSAFPTPPKRRLMRPLSGN